MIIKDQKGIEHKDRKLTSDEIKSYQEYTAPEVLRLLDPIALDGEKVETEKIEIRNDLSADTLEFKDANRKKKKEVEKSLKENLEILNSTRERNLKQ